VQFLGSKQLLVETADFAKRRRFAKNERAGHDSELPAEPVPKFQKTFRETVITIEPDGAASAQTMAVPNLFDHLFEQLQGCQRIGIHENKPIPGGRGRPGISSAGDLIDWFENDAGASRARHFRSAVVRIIVANN